MKTLQSRWPGGNSYRPTFAAYTAQAIAAREAREDENFSGHHGPDGGTASQGRRSHAPGFRLASCIVCGVSPAPFLDFVRGGFVCAAHKPERGTP